MIGKLSLVLLLALAVSANPAANQPWHWIHRRLYVSPNFNAIPFGEVIKDVVRPRPTHTCGIVTVDDCGKAPLAPQVSPVIVGGEEAPAHAFPWEVGLFIDNMYFCGGSIISNQWVMTAAHCMDGAYEVKVVAGAQDIQTNEPSQVTMVSTDHFVNENWVPSLVRNDIAMIKLPQNLTFNDYIQPVCLPTTTETDLGAGVTVTPTGWGKTSDGFGGISNDINEVNVQTITNSDCAATYGGIIITDNIICTSGDGGKGTCSGDSGGPLNYQIGGVTETRGIVSFGAAAGCEKGYPDAFTRVTHYLDWIQENTGVTR